MKTTLVILPVRNESAIIADTLSEVIQFLSENLEYEFVFVDDASEDDTAGQLKRGIKGYSRINLIEIPVNQGKCHAIKVAIGTFQADYYCFTDGDRAYSLDQILKLREALNEYDLVIGNRTLSNYHPRSNQRHVAGEAFNRLVRVLLRLPYTDTQAGLKGFRGRVARKLFFLQRVKDFSFDAELLYIAKLKEYTVGQIPAVVRDEHQDLPSNLKLFKDSPRMFLSILSILFNHFIGRYRG